MTTRHLQKIGSCFAATIFAVCAALGQTTESPQAVGLGPWATSPAFTIGETVNGYTPPGVPDGMGAFDRGETVEIVSNHELQANAGYVYMLANGTQLRGARISSMVFDKETRELVDAGLAYHTIINRAGMPVASPADLEAGALSRLCSAGSYSAGQSGFVDDAFFAGEERSSGTEFVLDLAGDVLYAAPWMGRAAWESVAALDVATIKNSHVAILGGDDRGNAPLLLYVGEKQPGGSFLERNGLVGGSLYMWVADSGDLSPADWSGTGTTRRGRFVEVENYDANASGSLYFDELGFARQFYLDQQKVEIGAFNFSRPEDLHTSPVPGRGDQVVLASTGLNTALNQGADRWGTTYIIDVKINKGRIQTGNIKADITIAYDGDDAGLQFAHPDLGIRSPDNLVWADNGQIYIQEDRSVGGFGAVSGEETSIWALDPRSGVVERVAQVHRAGVPSGQIDTDPNDLGDWETSGIIDVTDMFGVEGERLLFFNVQAHSVRSLAGGRVVGGDLEQGGQYLFLGVPDGGDGGFIPPGETVPFDMNGPLSTGTVRFWQQPSR